MADCMPFNSINNDRVYKAEDWAWYFSTFIGTGVFAKPETGLKVYANEGMKLTVYPGFAFINGYAFRNRMEFNITLDTADGVLARIDRIVVRWDLTKRDIYITVLKGKLSENPIEPAITRNVEIYDLVLADIHVSKGITEIKDTNITDRRIDSNLCGVVTGTVETEGKLKELIDSVSESVKNVAGKSVANNLTTTNEGFLLDARQGKVIYDEMENHHKSIHNLEDVTYKYSSKELVLDRGEFKLEQNQYMMLGQRIMLLQLCVTVKNVGTGLEPWTEFKLTDIENVKLNTTMHTHVVSDSGNGIIRLSINNNGELFLNTLGYIMDNNRTFRTIFILPLANSCWLN